MCREDGAYYQKQKGSRRAKKRSVTHPFDNSGPIHLKTYRTGTAKGQFRYDYVNNTPNGVMVREITFDPWPCL